MSDFKAKMHQIVCRLGSAPDPEYTYIFCVIGPWPLPPTTKSFLGPCQNSSAFLVPGCRLTQVILEKRLLNEGSSVVVVISQQSTE